MDSREIVEKEPYDPAERLRYQNEMAHSVLKGLFAVNGGAILALLTFIGHSDAHFAAAPLRAAFRWFGMGLLATLVASVGGYFAHGSARLDREASARIFEWLGIVAIAVAFIGFAGGASAALDGILVN